MNLEILTPDQKVFSGEVLSVNVPGTHGAFEVLQGHAPIVSNLTKGNVVIRTTTKDQKNVTITGGIVEVLNNKVIILADAVKQD